MSRNYGGTMVANLFARFGADTQEYEKKMRAVVTRMLFAAESFTQAGRILTTGVTVPLAALGFQALKTAMQFDSAMTRIVSLVGVAADKVDSWRPVVQQMAGEVGKSATELAEALFFITSNGIKSDQALQVLRSSAMAAAVGLGETKDVAFAATSAMNAYGKGALTADEAVAVLIGTVREGNIEAATLPPALGRLLPVAAAMGVEFHEAGAAIAQMTRAGTSARLASMGMRSILLGLLAPSKSARMAAEKLGTSFEELRHEAEDNLLGALLHMKEAAEANGMSLKRLFVNQKAYTAAVQLLGENVDQTKETFAAMAKVVGEDVAKAFAITEKTPMQKFNEAMAKLNNALITLGNNLGPIADQFGGLADMVQESAKWFDGLPPTAKSVTIGLTEMLMTVGPLTYAFGSLARMAARFTGLSILFKAAWVKKVAAMMMGKEAADLTAGSFTILGKSVKSVASGMVAAGIAGWEFGKLIDKWFGITDWLNKKFGELQSSAESVADIFDKDAVAMWDAANQADGLARKIGQVDLANKLMAAAHAGNTRAVSTLIQKINEEAEAYNKARIKVDGLTTAQEEQLRKEKIIAEQKAQAIALEEERMAQVLDEHELMTKDQVIEKMDTIIGQYQDSINKGVVLSRVNKNFGDELLEILGWAKDYKLTLPDAAMEMAKSMHDTGSPAAKEIDDILKEWPTMLNEAPGEFIDGMVKVGDKIADTLKGGLNRGFAEGMNEYTAFDEQLNTALNVTLRKGFGKGFDGFREEMQKIVDETLSKPVVVPVIPDADLFNSAYQDIIEGRIPDTGG